eukprot:124175-Rhodomonas_salina.4
MGRGDHRWQAPHRGLRAPSSEPVVASVSAAGVLGYAPPTNTGREDQGRRVPLDIAGWQRRPGGPAWQVMRSAARLPLAGDRDSEQRVWDAKQREYVRQLRAWISANSRPPTAAGSQLSASEPGRTQTRGAGPWAPNVV